MARPSAGTSPITRRPHLSRPENSMPSMQSLLAHLPKQTEGRLVLSLHSRTGCQGHWVQVQPWCWGPSLPQELCRTSFSLGAMAQAYSLLPATQLQDPILVGTWNGIRGQLARGQHDVSEVQ